MQWFDEPENNFSAFLETLPKKTAKYESWLKFVRLPKLQCNHEHPTSASVHTIEGKREGPLIFDHLRNIKNVERICEVVVPDCKDHPHANEAIISCLQ